jgi:hypothetical protein
MFRLKVRDFSGFSSTGNSLFAIAGVILGRIAAYCRASASLARKCRKQSLWNQMFSRPIDTANLSNVSLIQRGRDFLGCRTTCRAATRRTEGGDRNNPSAKSIVPSAPDGSNVSTLPKGFRASRVDSASVWRSRASDRASAWQREPATARVWRLPFSTR